MHNREARLLLGPAGAGKTWRCLAEVRRRLEAAPEGPPLVFLAPKQATFQLERQLLCGSNLQGYSRLQILSFERLAQFVLAELGLGEAGLLSEEGRVMVLRALLGRRRDSLKIFRSAARLPGFASQLSLLLRELQRHQLSPRRLARLRERFPDNPLLQNKLSDLELILDDYLQWLKARELEDANVLPDLAATALKSASAELEIAGLWMDGFAEMTPQELDLLAALLPFCREATLAFCLDPERAPAKTWLSSWAAVEQTVGQCQARLEGIPGLKLRVEALERGEKGRFAERPALGHLERFWTRPEPYYAGARSPAIGESIRVEACPGLEEEAAAAARGILREARENGTRFRQMAVLTRDLERYYEPLRRVFRRYEIPFFLDRRETVAHHPLAELTRHGLRAAAYGWQRDDWFGALKTGLVPAREDEIDRLENRALEQGWNGASWLAPLSRASETGTTDPDIYEPLRRRLLEPFLRLLWEMDAEPESKDYEPASDYSADLRRRPAPDGIRFAGAMRNFWRRMGAEQRLERWAFQDARELRIQNSEQVHVTVWEQMQAWLDNLERAFEGEFQPLNEWLPILEAGLGQLTVGVIPPSLDQVLIGAVDRSRNPDLEAVWVLGMNDGVFPAPPEPATLLNEADRESLRREGLDLSGSQRRRLAHEWYYGYIACTRARRRLTLSYPMADAEGTPLNPSPLADHVRRLLPEVKTEESIGPAGAPETWEHACEVLPRLLRRQMEGSEVGDPVFQRLARRPDIHEALRRWEGRRFGEIHETLSPEWAQKLYGDELRVSAGALEDFASCPLKFFIARGLGAKERERFEIDPKERGTFQHAVLKRFHEGLEEEGLRWRDLTPEEARRRVEAIGRELASTSQKGLFNADALSAFSAELLTEGTARLAETLTRWMDQYRFDPRSVETKFGMGEDSPLPGWRVDLGNGRSLLLRGVIDRIDLAPLPESGAAAAAVFDYKSSEKKLNPVKMKHGLQLQLAVYLNVLGRLTEAADFFQVDRLLPAGVFYVNLKGRSFPMAHRDAAPADSAEAALKLKYQHAGRFDVERLPLFDSRPNPEKGDQFRYKITSKGAPYKDCDALPSENFDGFLNEMAGVIEALGREIFEGKIAASPYRKGGETACDYCEWKALCRFDPRADAFRDLA